MKNMPLALSLTALLACAVLGCADDPISVRDSGTQSRHPLAASNILSKSAEGTVSLQGLSLFDVYAKKEHLMIEDSKEYNLPCSAELVFGEHQTFVLTTTEWLDTYAGIPFRIISFAGKMSSGGQLKFTWPATWMEVTNWETMTLEAHSDVLAQFRDHTGMEISGPGVNKNTVDYIGSFTGSHLVAGFHLEGFPERIGSMGAPFDVLHDGPISVHFSLDLTVIK